MTLPFCLQDGKTATQLALENGHASCVSLLQTAEEAAAAGRLQQ
jgi:hypothetical protein